MIYISWVLEVFDCLMAREGSCAIFILLKDATT
jgi:hypothetical protein